MFWMYVWDTYWNLMEFVGLMRHSGDIGIDRAFAGASSRDRSTRGTRLPRTQRTAEAERPFPTLVARKRVYLV